MPELHFKNAGSAEGELAMARRGLISILTVILFAGGFAMEAQKIVNPDESCRGEKVARGEVLLLDVSESLDQDEEIRKFLADQGLRLVKKKLIETEMAASMRGAFRKAAKQAGKEGCEAVIVVRKGVGRHQETAVVATGGGFTGLSVPDSDEWVEVLFAEKD